MVGRCKQRQKLYRIISTRDYFKRAQELFAELNKVVSKKVEQEPNAKVLLPMVKSGFAKTKDQLTFSEKTAISEGFAKIPDSVSPKKAERNLKILAKRCQTFYWSKHTVRSSMKQNLSLLFKILPPIRFFHKCPQEFTKQEIKVLNKYTGGMIVKGHILPNKLRDDKPVPKPSGDSNPYNQGFVVSKEYQIPSKLIDNKENHKSLNKADEHFWDGTLDTVA